MKKFLIILALLTQGYSSSLNLLISETEIQQKISKVSLHLNKKFKDQPLTIILVMKGAFILGADLVRSLNMPLNIETIRCKSYGLSGDQPTQLKVEGIDKLQLEGRNVLVVDDIFDRGVTLDTVMKAIKSKNPASLSSLVLLQKEVPHTVGSRPDYVLFSIPPKFVVGYGMDYKEQHRELKGVYEIEF